MNTAIAYRARRSSSSDSNTDSEAECDVWKRTTKSSSNHIDDSAPVATCSVPLNTPPKTVGIKKRKVNTVWSDVVIEEAVSENLGHIRLNKIPITFQDRNCESYDFSRKELDDRPDPLDEQNMDSEDFDNNKKKSSGFRCAKKNHQDRQVAHKIIFKLGEPKTGLIYRAVRIIGAKKAIELLKMTEDVEEHGGMLIKNKLRRRTPGGVYLQLLKAEKSITKEQIDEIFVDDKPSTEIIQARRAAYRRKHRRNQSDHWKSSGMEITEADSAIIDCASALDSQDNSETSTDYHSPNNSEISPGYVPRTPTYVPCSPTYRPLTPTYENFEADILAGEIEDGEILD